LKKILVAVLSLPVSLALAACGAAPHPSCLAIRKRLPSKYQVTMPYVVSVS
jgi:hypothetical protein